MTDDRASIRRLPAIQGSLIEQHGWADITQRFSNGRERFVIMDGDEPEAVVLSTGEYIELVNAARLRAGTAKTLTEADGITSLQALRERFDARLASLNAPGPGEKSSSTMEEPSNTKGK